MTDEQYSFFGELKRRKVYRVAIGYVVVAWVALQFFDLVFENVNAPDWVMQLIMAVFAIGLPVALVLAWAFDITHDGIKATPGSRLSFTVLIVVVSAGAVGYVAWSILGEKPDTGTVPTTADTSEIRTIDSIAVLPFESFSENRSDEYFADGLADTLLHKLAQLPNLKVIARNSSFQFKGTNMSGRPHSMTRCRISLSCRIAWPARSCSSCRYRSPNRTAAACCAAAPIAPKLTTSCCAQTKCSGTPAARYLIQTRIPLSTSSIGRWKSPTTRG